MRKTIGALTLLALAACQMPVDGKDQFKVRAAQKSAEFAENYQAMARCFDERRTYRHHNGQILAGGYLDSVKIYSDLGVAEYQDQLQNNWWQLIEFKKISDNRTKVEAFAMDPDLLSKQWATVEGCATA